MDSHMATEQGTMTSDAGVVTGEWTPPSWEQIVEEHSARV
jgi:RNA polymerase sigma-70 factor (ECF subfamily)